MNSKSKENDLDVLHDQAEQAVKSYLDFLKTNPGKGLPDPDMASEVLCLFDFEHRSNLWEYGDNLGRALEALTDPQVNEIISKKASPHCVKEVAKIIRKMIYFIHEIQDSDAYLAALDHAKLDVAGSEKGDEADLQKIAIKYTCRLSEAKKLSEIHTTDNN